MRSAADYIGLIVHGGELNFLGQGFNVLGLTKSGQILSHALDDLPKNSPIRDDVQQVVHFATLARQNLDLAKPLLGSIAHPIAVDTQVISGSPPSLDAFAISVSATLTLMFVTVLLVAGSLASSVGFPPSNRVVHRPPPQPGHGTSSKSAGMSVISVRLDRRNLRHWPSAFGDEDAIGR